MGPSRGRRCCHSRDWQCDRSTESASARPAQIAGINRAEQTCAFGGAVIVHVLPPHETAENKNALTHAGAVGARLGA